MPSIKVKENEPFDVALRRFKRSCEKAGLIAEVRKREHYEKPTRFASAPQPPRSSATPKRCHARTASVSVSINLAGASPHRPPLRSL